MRKQSFLEFIIENSKTNSPIGDFCEDTLRLIRMGRRPNSYTLSGIILFMKVNRACEEAVEAAKEAWCEWKSVI